MTAIPSSSPHDQDARACKSCGGRLMGGGGLAGLCPECLVRLGIGPSKVVVTGGATLPSPPSCEELDSLLSTYRVEEMIGRGGSGAVYRARQVGLERTVALKVLMVEDENDPSFTERFTREAQALASLGHPGIVHVYDFGRAGKHLYLVMEFVEGLNLRELLRRGDTSPRESLAIVTQICDALQYAHDQGIVHRDIKPENILVDRTGKVKITDFGLAKLVGPEPEAFHLTGTGQVMGTPHYMAPEQIEHPLEVDHRADIYSLGVVFYELLTGELPIGRFTEPSKKRVEVDVRLDEVVLRALEKEPEQRFQNAADVASRVTHISRTERDVDEDPQGLGATAAAVAAAVTEAGEAIEGALEGENGWRVDENGAVFRWGLGQSKAKRASATGGEEEPTSWAWLGGLTMAFTIIIALVLIQRIRESSGPDKDLERGDLVVFEDELPRAGAWLMTVNGWNPVESQAVDRILAQILESYDEVEARHTKVEWTEKERARFDVEAFPMERLALAEMLWVQLERAANWDNARPFVKRSLTTALMPLGERPSRFEIYRDDSGYHYWHLEGPRLGHPSFDPERPVPGTERLWRRLFAHPTSAWRAVQIFMGRLAEFAGEHENIAILELDAKSGPNGEVEIHTNLEFRGSSSGEALEIAKGFESWLTQDPQFASFAHVSLTATEDGLTVRALNTTVLYRLKPEPFTTPTESGDARIFLMEVGAREGHPQPKGIQSRRSTRRGVYVDELLKTRFPSRQTYTTESIQSFLGAVESSDYGIRAERVELKAPKSGSIGPVQGFELEVDFVQRRPSLPPPPVAPVAPESPGSYGGGR